MSTVVKIVLAVVIAAILIGVLYSVLSSLVMYVLLAGGAVAALALLWRWLAGGRSRDAAFRLAAGSDKRTGDASADKQAEKRAARALRKLERDLRN